MKTVSKWTSFVAILVIALMSVPAFTQAAPAVEASVTEIPVNINQASQEELESLRGIGPVVAERVVSYRAENGDFQNTEELMNVKGIGRPTYERLKDHITL